MTTNMTVERALRLLGGFMVLLSLALTYGVDPRFVWLTVFVGLNQFQSGFTDWCPATWVFQKLGLKREGSCAAASPGARP